MNIAIFISSILILTWVLSVAIRLGKEGTIVYLLLLELCMNLFVLKQIEIFGWYTTASEPLAVGYVIAFNTFQEVWGKKAALHLNYLSLLTHLCFVGLSMMHLLYIPVDGPDYASILAPMPRILGASIATFFLIQLFDRHLFDWVQRKMQGRFFLLRLVGITLFTEAVDTLLFSFLGLWGVVSHLYQVIAVAFIVKMCALAMFAIFLSLNKLRHHEPLLSF